jgi:ubiquinone/menaquinone biosynthesis C-methylase UbiE
MPSPDPKRAAIELWTCDPCEARSATGEPGTASYLTSLLAARRAYAPWMADELDYAGSRGRRVLDVGCGQGIDVVEYSAAGAEVHGIDLTPRHVELARKHLTASRLPGVVQLGDADAIPFPSGSFDRVSSNGVLHHTPTIETALLEILRVLRVGGQATVIVYNRGSLHYWLQQVLLRGVMQGGWIRERSMGGVLSTGVEYSSIGVRPLVRVYSRRQIQRLMEAAGFDEVTVHPRHFKPSDSFLTSILAGAGVAGLQNSGTQDRIGRVAGWYLVARGRRANR